MKTRQGFVSNSSSSSFLIMGLRVKRDQIKNLSMDQLKELLDPEDYYALEREFTQQICCGKVLKTDFCPTCGKAKKDVAPVLDVTKMLNSDSIFSYSPPDELGFFEAENGIYYCTSIGGNINNILKERERFIKGAAILCPDFPLNADVDSMVDWLNRNLIIDGGEYFNG